MFALKKTNLGKGNASQKLREQKSYLPVGFILRDTTCICDVFELRLYGYRNAQRHKRVAYRLNRLLVTC